MSDKVISLFNNRVALDAILSFLFLWLYTRMVIRVNRHWTVLPEFRAITPRDNSTSTDQPLTTISIIVPYRNEEETIIRCLTCLSKQKYPAGLFEIIAVDDHSTDASFRLVEAFSKSNASCVLRPLSHSSNEGKKAALNLGISASASELILTIDADCSMGENMLSDLVAFYEKYHPKMIIGPVAMENDVPEWLPNETANDTICETLKNPLHEFQDMEFSCISAFSAVYCDRGKPFLCNGANLAYQRAAFIEAAGFSGNLHLSSGDDTFLLKKFQNLFPGQIRFLKSSRAIVQTLPQKNVFDFLQQRVRWASKSFADTNPVSRLVALRVAAINILLLVNLILSIFYGKFAAVFVSIFIVKSAVDYRLLTNVSGFFKKRFRFIQVLANALFYPLYSLIILFLSLRLKYEWKGRKTR